MTRDEWDGRKTAKRKGANRGGTCALDALRKASGLIGVPGLFARPRVEAFRLHMKRPAVDMLWEDIAALIRFCNIEQRKLGLPTVVFTGKKQMY